jgi:hypothetical protein
MPAIDKPRVLRATNFGKRTAEEEAGELASYFVETEQWRRMLDGDVDVVYGANCAGKARSTLC